MCWSFEASLITWIIGLISGIYLLYRKHKNDIVMGTLVLAYSSMQLWEALMWYDQKCGKLNAIATKFAYIALWTHVLAIGIGLRYEYKTVIPLYIGLCLLLTAYITRPKTWECSVPAEKSKHLIWGFNPDFYMLVFGISIILCLTYITPARNGILISSLFLSSFILSYFTNASSGTVGSFWCWLCAAFCFVFIAIN